PGWATHLPEDPTTYHTGQSDKARRFQQAFSNIEQAAGWSTSHMCLAYTIHQLRFAPPRSYLEIGVNEGLSLFALITAVQLQYLLTGTPAPPGLLEELVLADAW